MANSNKQGRFIFRVIRRLLLVVLTAAVLSGAGLWILLNQVLNGPSPAARDALTISLLDSEQTSWIPGLFLEDDLVEQIRLSAGTETPGEVTDPSLIALNPDTEEWQSCPEGIRIEQYQTEAFSAHIMILRDPSRMYLAYAEGGAKIADQLASEGAAGGVYAAVDTDSLLISRGRLITDSPAAGGFAGFTVENILVLAGSMTAEEAQALDIRDGCGCGLILILNGQINEGAYNANSGYGSRVCIGQRADGSVIILTIDGLSASSVGGTWRDCIDILYEYGCVNACSLDDVPAAMLYDGHMIHSDSLPRAESAVLPGFWMIRTGKEG